MTRLRVLCIATRHPEPAEVGSDVRVRWLLHSLAGVAGADITFLTAARSGQGPSAALLDAELGVTTELVHLNHEPRRGALLRWAAGIRRGRPVWISDLWSDAFARRVTKLRAQHDVVVYLDDAAGQYELDQAAGPPVFFDKHMVMTWICTQEPTRGRPALLFGARARLVAALTRRFETRTLALGGAITCSSEDDARLQETLGVTSAATITTGAPHRPVREQVAGAERQTVGFLGALDIGPNLQGLLRFVEDGGTRGLGELGLTLSVAGRAPRTALPPAIADDAHVRIEGFVEDLDAWFASLVALVVPVWTGSGVKTKTVTAMMVGVPVVATPDGFEGVPVVHGVHGLVATTATEIVVAVRRLLDDPDLAAAMGRAGRDLVLDRLSLSASTATVGALVQTVS